MNVIYYYLVTNKWMTRGNSLLRALFLCVEYIVYG